MCTKMIGYYFTTIISLIHPLLNRSDIEAIEPIRQIVFQFLPNQNFCRLNRLKESRHFTGPNLAESKFPCGDVSKCNTCTLTGPVDRGDIVVAFMVQQFVRRGGSRSR